MAVDPITEKDIHITGTVCTPEGTNRNFQRIKELFKKLIGRYGGSPPVSPPTVDADLVDPTDPITDIPAVITVPDIPTYTYNPATGAIDGGVGIATPSLVVTNEVVVGGTIIINGGIRFQGVAFVPGQVRTSVTDALDYLEDQFFDITNVAPTAGLEMPIPVYSDGDQLRVRIKPADITPSYSGGVIQLLGHDSSGLWKWYSVTACP